MKINVYCFLLFFSIIGSRSFATNPIPYSWTENYSISDQNDAKLGVGEKIIQSKIGQWIVKKLKNTKITSKQMKTLGILSLVVGAASLISLFLIFTVTWGWWVAFGLAIIGDILSITTLIRTAKQKKEFKQARTMAWFGLVLSLLTGILPLTLFILILISI